MILEYTIYGRPRAWQRAGSHAGRRFTPKAVRDEQQKHRDVATLAMRDDWPREANMRLTIEFRFAGGNVGDVDNYAKLVMDALNRVAYADDKQVVELTARKSVARGEDEWTLVRLEAV